ncbi:type II secretion system F family protein [Quadrisphaera sp. INWT6]|uniref:type II secretion system F family protein n=1 Tax=Quadrisphaera sp. INWT6 TaxID=2596917 RepID=UPI00189210EE|nr:type II secretion system F family protein [Quadrisphaera sp. INWT6]MBF5080229.1 type II secretion system protein F [Quadrisphaera sp. INWT6]
MTTPPGSALAAVWPAGPVEIAVLTLLTLVVAVVAAAVVDGARARSRAVVAVAGGASADPLARLLASSRRGFARTRLGRGLADRLAGGSVRLAPLDFAALVLGAGVLAALVVRPLLGVVGGLLVVALAVVGASRWLQRRRGKRVEAFVGQLPEVARVMSNASAAGLSMPTAVGMVAREVADPAGTEFRVVSEQMALGASLDTALLDLDRRLPSRELRVLVRTLVIQRRSGGALSTALAGLAGTLEQRKELRREVITAVSGARFSGVVVALLGVVSVFVMNLISPGALDALATSGPGRLVLLASAVLFAVGGLLIRRLTDLEV